MELLTSLLSSDDSYVTERGVFQTRGVIIQERCQ